jgi:A/G-specific adenine glycosylase
VSAFAVRIAEWQERSGRHDLPWQNTSDAYAIWVSEIMLQQTQVTSVLRYFPRFMQRFPDVISLARAVDDDVLASWSGLGYYSRARNLKRAAELVTERHGGRVPEPVDDLMALPGIGRSTAAAIRVFAFGSRDAILDGNVKRVLARSFAIEGWPGTPAVERRLWALARELLPDGPLAGYTQGLMDLGATLCTRTRPRCGDCPVAGECRAFASASVDRIPGPRPRQQTPRRRAVFLIARDPLGRVLLERRPPSGIWGGLWSLPEFGSAEAALAACRARFRVETRAPGEGRPLQHAFTHFKLEMVPLAVRVSPSPGGHAAEPGELWVAAAALDEAPLPAPVRALLAREEG